MSTQSPGASARASVSSAKRKRALPASTVTHSASAWSYQNPGGLAWPHETIRSMRRPGLSRRVRQSRYREVAKGGSRARCRLCKIFRHRWRVSDRRAGAGKIAETLGTRVLRRGEHRGRRPPPAQQNRRKFLQMTRRPHLLVRKSWTGWGKGRENMLVAKRPARARGAVRCVGNPHLCPWHGPVAA